MERLFFLFHSPRTIAGVWSRTQPEETQPRGAGGGRIYARTFAMEAHQKALTKTHLHVGCVEVPKKDDNKLHVKPVAYLCVSFPWWKRKAHPNETANVNCYGSFSSSGSQLHVAMSPGQQRVALGEPAAAPRLPQANDGQRGSQGIWVSNCFK